MTITFKFNNQDFVHRILEQFSALDLNLVVKERTLYNDGETAYSVETVTPTFLADDLSPDLKNPYVIAFGPSPWQALCNLHEKFEKASYFAIQSAPDSDNYRTYKYEKNAPVEKGILTLPKLTPALPKTPANQGGGARVIVT